MREYLESLEGGGGRWKLGRKLTDMDVRSSAFPILCKLFVLTCVCVCVCVCVYVHIR